jgi:hypothetical protein
VESSLSITMTDLESQIGHFLGYGTGPAAGGPTWSSAQRTVIRRCLDSGLRNFYYPSVVGPEKSYSWSFFRPTTTVVLEADANSVAMPDDFGGIEGDVAVSVSGGSYAWASITPGGEGVIRQAEAREPTRTGAPMYLAIRAIKGTTINRSNRYELVLFPLADQEYTLSFAYSILADRLTSANPYAYGGAYHAETLIEACLAFAEMTYNNIPNGPHKAAFAERLAASISIDRRYKPTALGYNGPGGLWDRGAYFRQPPDITFHPEHT